MNIEYSLKVIEFINEFKFPIMIGFSYFILVILTSLGFNIAITIITEFKKIIKKYRKNSDKITIDKWFTLDYNNSYYLIEINGKKDKITPMKFNNESEEFENIEDEEELKTFVQYIKDNYEL